MPKPTIPTVVEELPSFRRAAKGLLNEEQKTEIVTAISSDPEAGVLLEGTGGVRKRRFGIDQRGKSGGIRVIYFFHDLDMPTYLLTVFAKNDIENLTQAERNQLRAIGDPACQ